MSDRKLLAPGVRDPVCPEHGLLPHPNLHSLRPHRHHLLGQLLAQQKRDTSSSRSWCHHCAHHDYAHVLHKRCAAKDFLCEIDRRLLGHLFRDGVRITIR